MIRKPTVLVFGAGVSCDYGFPTGRKLLTDVANNLRAPSRLYQQMEELEFDKSFMLQFSRELRDSMLPSVDAFLAVQKDQQYLRLGKLAIAASLIPLEKDNLLRSRDELKLYEYLWSRLTGTPETYAGNRLSVITFNYDRSFEQFLRQVLFASHPECRGHPARFRSALSHFEVHHIYGSLGDLDDTSAGYLPYAIMRNRISIRGRSVGSNPTAGAILESAKSCSPKGFRFAFVTSVAIIMTRGGAAW